MSRRRRFLKILKWVVIVSLLALLWAAWPGRSTFTISPETTYVTGPVDKDGYIDYVTALNERLRGDIKPEENANVLILKALGTNPEGRTMPPDYFSMLGIETPKQSANDWITFSDHLKTFAHVDIPYEVDEFRNRMFRAATHPWRSSDELEVADWLRRNEVALSQMDEASRKRRYYSPLLAPRDGDWSDGLDMAPVSSAHRCREVAYALACRAMLHLNEGKDEFAWKDILVCHRLGRLVTQGGCIIEWLVGNHLGEIASSATIAFISNSKFSRARIEACALDLRNLPPMASVADIIDIGERFVFLDTVMLTIKQGTLFLNKLIGLDYTGSKGNKLIASLFDQSKNWDPAFQNGMRWYDRCAAAMRNLDRNAKVREIAAILEDHKSLRQQVTDSAARAKLFGGPRGRGSWYGDLLIGMKLPALDIVQRAEDRSDQSHRNLLLAFALAAYRADQKRYPATLAELAPKYIDTIPDDLFSGQALIYKLEGDGYLLYSVGQNGRDDGGQSFDDVPRGDDLVVRMPVRAPKKVE